MESLAQRILRKIGVLVLVAMAISGIGTTIHPILLILIRMRCSKMLGYALSVVVAKVIVNETFSVLLTQNFIGLYF